MKDSFHWPLGARQSSANQFTGKFVSAINDWAAVPIARHYEEHQKYVHGVYPEEINLTAVDNAHQAARLLKIYGGKRRLCDWFCSFKSSGAATLLDVSAGRGRFNLCDALVGLWRNRQYTRCD